MRVLPVCFMALFIAGCTSLPTQFDKSDRPDSTLKHPSAKENRVPSYVRLYTKPDELSSLTFKELGIVAGESCRSTLQDSPASIATARQNMLAKAAYLNANAVLLHQCAILPGQGCYQIAICEGSALLTTHN
ncbi:Rcs stress response system protein RcsF [Xenorhabdus doucetiae]|uniref:Outer membrane lipoprotein RcsF n=1 Tax=Xenorhabdus doucetiae TaxID=351671 RepID=A0A068QVC6_9GAMM|nr:Rcs stress response system protein RcsF [Xenorhabdus doucetiae]TYP07570.1 RcsF protein [Xenorhabdus doucetiae]CDG18972.1 Protein rcsF [Xenorhabdus doucetiae]